MKFNKIIASIVMLVATLAAAAAEPSAAAVMERTAKWLNSTKCVEAAVAMKLPDGGTSDATITVAGDRFTAVSPQMRVWFDGLTQWTWLRSSDEVSITEPTTDEMLQSNPFAIVNHYRNGYDIRRLASSKGTYTIELTARDRHWTVRKVLLTVNATTYRPERIVVTDDDNRTIDVAVTTIKTKAKAPAASVFAYDKRRFPASSIVDLR